MPCTSPLAFFRPDLENYRSGLRSTQPRPFPLSVASKSPSPDRPYTPLVLVPCGNCDSCLHLRASHWGIRCKHEAQMKGPSCFLTLTYSDEHLPSDRQLHHEHVQKFIKRLRYHLGSVKITYLCAGEYGSSKDRPHYHIMIFGYDFSADRRFFCNRKSGALYRSDFLESLWPYGYSTVADCSYYSARYIAKYSSKARFRHLSPAFRKALKASGVVFEYLRASNGLGLTWLRKYYKDIFPCGKIITSLKSFVSIPRYYLKKLESLDSSLYDSFVAARLKFVESLPDVTISSCKDLLSSLSSTASVMTARNSIYTMRTFDYASQNLRR